MAEHAQRYELRKLESGWTVWDNQTNTPAIHDGRWLTDLPMENADDLVDLLNHQDQSR